VCLGRDHAGESAFESLVAIVAVTVIGLAAAAVNAVPA
jgi:hypothetical protein